MHTAIRIPVDVGDMVAGQQLGSLDFKRVVFADIFKGVLVYRADAFAVDQNVGDYIAVFCTDFNGFIAAGGYGNLAIRCSIGTFALGHGDRIGRSSATTTAATTAGGANSPVRINGRRRAGSLQIGKSYLCAALGCSKPTVKGVAGTRCRGQGSQIRQGDNLL